MQRKPLLATVLAAAFIFPLAANAGGTDKPAGAKSASAPSAATNGGNDGGAEAMFASLDKNSDGFITKEEAMGTPHHGDFAKLDKSGDGKLSREEHAAAPEHVAGRSKGTANGSTTSGSTSSPTSSSDQASGAKKPY